MDKTVLLVEDDSLSRKGIAQALKDAGLTVIEASNGQEGLKQALANHPDVILTDLRMPMMDGLEMVAKLREDQWGAGVPIIIMTTDESTDSVNQALAAGVTTYLAKSAVDPDTIVEQVANALQ